SAAPAQTISRTAQKRRRIRVRFVFTISSRSARLNRSEDAPFRPPRGERVPVRERVRRTPVGDSGGAGRTRLRRQLSFAPSWTPLEKRTCRFTSASSFGASPRFSGG